MELSPWGIRVVLVEPAQTDTDLWRNAEQDADALESALSPGHRALYARHIAGFRKSIPAAQRAAVPAGEVAAVIERALTDRRPRARRRLRAAERPRARWRPGRGRRSRAGDRWSGPWPA
jgi:NAD(P)-dependent dehydrogenase (short-subunit alcohol dehydrogenase family)